MHRFWLTNQLSNCPFERSRICFLQCAESFDDEQLFECCEHGFDDGGFEQFCGLPILYVYSPKLIVECNWLVIAITTTSGRAAL